MYLEMIFGKNKEQTTRQLQFKFDPLPAESAEVCLFHQRWIKTFFTQPFYQLSIIYGLVFYQIDFVHFCNNYLVVPSQKTSFRALEKWKMVFSSNENGNFLRQHCLPFQYAPLCTIWDHLNKLCHECGIRLIIWLESHESSHMIAHFWEHFFKRITVLQVYYFPWKLGHI